MKKIWMYFRSLYIWSVEGDIENGIEPNTPFEDVPEDWVCPVCGSSKTHLMNVNKHNILLKKRPNSYIYSY